MDNETKKCPGCGEMLNKNEKFCHACGQKADVPVDGETKKCPGCGEILNKNEKFCHACGQKADIPADGATKKCPGCGEILNKNEKFCHACGQKADVPANKDSGRFCPVCGAINPLSSTFCSDCGKGLVKSGRTQPAAAPEKQPEADSDAAVPLSSRLFRKSFGEFREINCNKAWLCICNEIDHYQTSERYLSRIKQDLENSTRFLPQSYAFAEHNIALQDQVLQKVSAWLAPDEKFVIFISSARAFGDVDLTPQVVLSLEKYAQEGILVTNKRIYGMRRKRDMMIESIANIHSLIFGSTLICGDTALRFSNDSNAIHFFFLGGINSAKDCIVPLVCLLAMESHPQGYQIEVSEAKIFDPGWGSKLVV